MLGLLALVPAGAAWAAEPSAKEAGKPFATVWRVRGEVAAAGAAGGNRILKEGDRVFVGERVRAASAGEAVLRTADAGAVAVRPGAEFVAERFVAEGKSTDSSILRLITGSLRLITGWIGHTNRASHQVLTPTATIGIRGTDHEPYVMAADQAAATSYKEGTYDKVNRGRTALEANGHDIEIEPGRVGFAPVPPRFSNLKQRALITILMPVLLDKVPAFYVPGEFDAELDQYSEVVDILSRRELARLGVAAAPGAAAPTVAPTAEPVPAAPAAAPAPAVPVPEGCQPAVIGKAWLEALDGAIDRLDALAIIGAFAPDVVVRASVRGRDGGMTTVELGRDDLARSTVAAITSLEGYRHRRVSIDSTLAGTTAEACDRIVVKSVVIEQGLQAGKPFRFESLEEYLIELRGGQWLAVKAATTQR